MRCSCTQYHERLHKTDIIIAIFFLKLNETELNSLWFCYLCADDVQSHISFLILLDGIRHQLVEAWHISCYLYKQLLFLNADKCELLFIGWPCLTVCDLCCCSVFFFLFKRLSLPSQALFLPTAITLHIDKPTRYIGVLLKLREFAHLMIEMELYLAQTP